MENVADLSGSHGPCSEFLSLSDADVSNYQLSADQIEFFQANGYVVGPRILSSEQLNWLRDELAPLLQPDHSGHEFWHEYHSNESVDPNRILFHALGAWRIRPGFHDLLWHPGFVIPATQLLDGPVRFWHDQLFCKPAQHGGVVAWHQDYSYWTRTRPMQHLTCWIGLDDSTVDNGCVHYIPGSHRWPLLPVTGLAGDMTAIRGVLNDEQQDQFNHPAAVELAAGQCVFHHPLMVHGSFENSTDNPRRATVINAFRDGVMSASDEPLLEQIPVVPPGEPLAGQFFPLLSR